MNEVWDDPKEQREFCIEQIAYMTRMLAHYKADLAELEVIIAQTAALETHSQDAPPQS